MANYFNKRNMARGLVQNLSELETGEQKVPDMSISTLAAASHKFTAIGGVAQESRMIRDKRRSLDRALLYSYQSVYAKKVNNDDANKYRVLINPYKLRQDYDDKIFSAPFEDGFAEGQVFEWVGTNSYWLIFLQDYNEQAYFRSSIRRCNYEMAWEDDEGNKHSTYCTLRGPVETRIDYIQKHGISIDKPNYSIHILMPSNDETLAYFQRYRKFYLQGEDTCWRIEAIDWLSTPGIIEIEAVEYYSNTTEDDVENGVVGGLIVEPIDPNPVGDPILGETFIRPKKSYEYTYSGGETGTWSIDPKYPVSYTIDGNKITLKWLEGYSGQFILKYGTQEKTIVVESLF